MIKSIIENSKVAKYLLLCVTMLGTSMVIGDGILTPVISGILYTNYRLNTTTHIHILTLLIIQYSSVGSWGYQGSCNLSYEYICDVDLGCDIGTIVSSPEVWHS